MSSIDRIINMLRNELDRHEILQLINDFSEDLDLETFIGDWDESELEEFFKNKFPNYADTARFIDPKRVNSGALHQLSFADRERLILAVLEFIVRDKFAEIFDHDAMQVLVDTLVKAKPNRVLHSLEKSDPSFIKTYVAGQIRQSDTLDELHQLHQAVLTDRLEISEVIDHLCQLSPHGKEAAGKAFIEHGTDADWNNLVIELTDGKAQTLLKSILATYSWEKLNLPTQDKKLELVRFGDWDYTLFYGGLFLLKIDSLASVKEITSRLPIIKAKYAGIMSFQQAYNEYVKGADNDEAGTE